MSNDWEDKKRFNEENAPLDNAGSAASTPVDVDAEATAAR